MNLQTNPILKGGKYEGKGKIYFEDGEIKEKLLLDDINQIDDYYEGDLWNLK